VPQGCECSRLAFSPCNVYPSIPLSLPHPAQYGTQGQLGAAPDYTDMAPRKSESLFSYSLSRPYPFRWFTYVVAIGGAICAVLFSFVALAPTATTSTLNTRPISTAHFTIRIGSRSRPSPGCPRQDLRVSRHSSPPEVHTSRTISGSHIHLTSYGAKTRTVRGIAYCPRLGIRMRCLRIMRFF
jgi:hypothetical protein